MLQLNYEAVYAKRVFILLAAIVLSSTLCRLYGLDKQAFEPDELYTIPASLGRHYRFQSDFRQPDRPVHIGLYRDLLSADPGGRGLREVTGVLKRNVHAPLYFYVMHFWVRWFGTSEAALRVPSAAFGVASIFLIFFLGRELFNPFVGLLSSAMLGLMPEQVYQSLNARMYSLLVLLALASTYALALLLRKRSSAPLYLLYGAASLAGLYTHYVYLFCFAAQTLYVWLLFWKRKELSIRWLVTQLCVTAAFAPWLLISLAQKQTSDEALSWVSGRLSAWEILLAVINKVALLTSAPEVPLGRLGQLAALVLIMFGIRELLSTRHALLPLLGLWVVVPVAGVLLADAMNATKTIGVTRYWMVVSPALYLLMSVGAQPLARRFGEVKPTAALVVVLSVAGFLTAGGVLRKKPFDYRGLTRQVEGWVEDAGRDVVLAEGPAVIPLALAYYGRRDILVWRLNLDLGEPSEQAFVAAMRDVAKARGVVWLLSDRADGAAAAALERAGFRPDDAPPQAGQRSARRYVAR